MVKSRTKSKGVSKSLRTAGLIVIGLIVIGGGYAAASTDLAYSAQSMLAAVTGSVDATPRLEIIRNAYTPSGSIWPGAKKVLAQFDVNPKYLASYGYLRNVTATVRTNSATAGLYVGDLGMRYLECNTDSAGNWVNCADYSLPVSSPGISKTLTGIVYEFQSLNTASFPYFPQVGSGKKGKITITGNPYYGTIYTDPAAPQILASVKAQIETATGTGNVCTTSSSSTQCSYKSVPVYTNLAYGNWLKVNRGSGFGYGYWDMNNSNSLTATDANTLLKVAVGSLACPVFKLCDINKSGSVTATDADLLLKYAVGSLPPPGTVSSTIDLIVPNGGENLVVGKTYSIQWKTTNFPTNATVYIELRPWSGLFGVPTRKIAVVSAAKASYTWTVPDTAAGEYRIEVYKADANGVIDQYNGAKDISQSSFKIIKFTEF